MQIRDKKIPTNYTPRREGHTPQAIVLHIMEGSLAGTDSWFRNPKSQVSSHYGIGKNGEIWNWVDEQNTAFTNGRVDKPTWKGYEKGVNPNFTTITIEHEGWTGQPWTEEMYAADVYLLKEIAKRWGIPLDRDHIIGHNEIYGKKPNCPGSGLDWSRLMSSVQMPIYRNQQVKGDKQPEIYYIDYGGVRHHIPSWDFYVEYFKGEPIVIPQVELEKIVEGKPFVLNP